MSNEMMSGIRVSGQREGCAEARSSICGSGREGRDAFEASLAAQGKQARPFRQGEVEEKEKRGHVRSAQRKRGAALDNKIDGMLIWKQVEDLLIPCLRLTLMERAVYSHLLRHSRLEGKQRLRFSIKWCAGSAGITEWSVRKAVRSLVAKGALRLAERTKRGHLIEVRLPEEVREVRTVKATGKAVDGQDPDLLESTDFLETRELREAIYAREEGRCFYCLRRVRPATRCIDHVIPQVRGGGNSYRNLVASCAECNAQKCEQSAEDFLRWLFREERLEASELKERLRALEELAAGKLRPVIAARP